MHLVERDRRRKEKLLDELLDELLIHAVEPFAFVALKLEQFLGEVQMATEQVLVDGQGDVLQPVDLVGQLLVDVRRKDLIGTGEREQMREEKKEFVRLRRVAL